MELHSDGRQREVELHSDGRQREVEVKSLWLRSVSSQEIRKWWFVSASLYATVWIEGRFTD